MFINQRSSSRIEVSHRVEVAHHRQHVEAGPAQQVAQVGDGGVGGDVGGEPPLPLCLSELEGAAQLVQRVSAHHGPNEHTIRFEDLLNLNSEGQSFILLFISHISVDETKGSYLCLTCWSIKVSLQLVLLKVVMCSRLTCLRAPGRSLIQCRLRKKQSKNLFKDTENTLKVKHVSFWNIWHFIFTSNHDVDPPPQVKQTFFIFTSSCWQPGQRYFL